MTLEVTTASEAIRITIGANVHIGITVIEVDDFKSQTKFNL